MIQVEEGMLLRHRGSGRLSWVYRDDAGFAMTLHLDGTLSHCSEQLPEKDYAVLWSPSDNKERKS